MVNCGFSSNGRTIYQTCTVVVKILIFDKHGSSDGFVFQEDEIPLSTIVINVSISLSPSLPFSMVSHENKKRVIAASVIFTCGEATLVNG